MTNKFDPVNSWIDNVQYSHSNSELTAKQYRRQLRIFTEFIEKTPQQILEDYDGMTDREFRRKYAQYLRALISHMRQEYTPGTIASYVGAIKSFFKYSDLPLGYVPTGRFGVTYHNRDITREEIAQIIAYANIRARAFFCMMAQSGLRPNTLCKLRYEHIQEDFEAGTIPMKIDVPRELAKGCYRNYFTFVGPETVRMLKLYLNTRPNVKPENYLFTQEKSDKPVDRKFFSKTFNRILRKLEERGVIKIREREYRKPAELRLYNLRKFFRKYATPAGFENVQYWMGHIVRIGQDEHYRPTDPEWHRKLYQEKAMPNLQIEGATLYEKGSAIARLERQLAEKDNQIEEVNRIMADVLQRFKALDDREAELARREKDVQFLQSGGVMIGYYGKHVTEELREEVKRAYHQAQKDLAKRLAEQKEQKKSTS